VKYAFVIEPGQHAELSASGVDRWATCTASPALIKGLPNHGSKYAAEGTAAHYIAAFHQVEMRNGERVTIDRWRGLTAKVEGYDIPLTEELCEAVQEFLDYIAANERPDDVAVIEQSFTPAMRKLHPKFGGSTDRVMWRESERLLRVYDYKHGAGVPVDVDDNKQLKYYALGALLSNPTWNALTVELVIAQPRCDHEQGRIRSYKFPAIDLIDYAAGLMFDRNVGDEVRAGEAIARIQLGGKDRDAAELTERFLSFVEIGEESPAARPMVHEHLM
jgi:hypothetical protein